MDLATTEKSFTVMVAAATFVAFWATWLAITWEPPIEARLQGPAHPAHEDAQRAERCGQAVAQGDVARLHAPDRRPAEPAARLGGRPDDAQAAPRRLPVARRLGRLRLHQARPAAGARLPDDPADLVRPARRVGGHEHGGLHRRRAVGLHHARGLPQEHHLAPPRGPELCPARGARPVDHLRRGRPRRSTPPSAGSPGKCSTRCPSSPPNSS